MPELTKYKETEVINVLAAGMPKGSGKSTFAMFAPGNKVVLQYDLGSPTLPPGVPIESVFVKTYPVGNTEPKLESDKWKRPKNVGMAIIEDIYAIRKGVLEGKKIKLGDEKIPWVLTPNDTVILDGLVQWSQHILDWVLAVNNVANPEDFKNAFAPWGKRLNTQRLLWEVLLPLPVNVVMTAWSKGETEMKQNASGNLVQVATGRIIPDLGGKMEIWGPGKMDAALYLYSENTTQGLKFMARKKPTGKLQWVGVRNDYSEKQTVDITVGGKDKTSPWERVFGKAE